MNCLNCGYCCYKYPVMIVDDPEKGISESNLVLQDGKCKCKHLQGDKPGEYKCAIHDYPWFKDTPCGQHGQFERVESDCRIGVYVVNGNIKL